MDHLIVLVGWYEGEGGDTDPVDPIDPIDPIEPTDPSLYDCNVTKWYSNCEPREGTVDRSSTDSAPRSNSQPYWRVQNSWGAGWGENGFAKMEMVDGRGPACLNCDVTWPILDVAAM